jgi:hypothetical protein
MNHWLFVFLLLVLWELGDTRKTAESLRPSQPERKERKPIFTPGASFWKHIMEAIEWGIACVVVLAIFAVLAAFVFVLFAILCHL